MANVYKITPWWDEIRERGSVFLVGFTYLRCATAKIAKQRSPCENQILILWSDPISWMTQPYWGVRHDRNLHAIASELTVHRIWVLNNRYLNCLIKRIHTRKRTSNAWYYSQYRRTVTASMFVTNLHLRTYHECFAAVKYGCKVTVQELQ